MSMLLMRASVVLAVVLYLIGTVLENSCAFSALEAMFLYSIVFSIFFSPWHYRLSWPYK